MFKAIPFSPYVYHVYVFHLTTKTRRINEFFIEEGRNYGVTWEPDLHHLHKEEEVHYQSGMTEDHPELPALPPH